MADPISAAAREFDKARFRGAIAEINREKEKAAEHVGAAGAATKSAVDAMNLNKHALGFVAKLSRKEPDEQASASEAAVLYMHAMGFFDQAALDGGAIELMRKIVADADAGVAGAKSPVVTALTQQSATAPAH